MYVALHWQITSAKFGGSPLGVFRLRVFSLPQHVYCVTRGAMYVSGSTLSDANCTLDGIKIEISPFFGSEWPLQPCHQFS